MSIGGESTEYDPADKIDIEKPAPSFILKIVSTNRAPSSGKTQRDERGDPSAQALKVTIVVCLIGLVAVYLFALAPKNGGSVSSATPAPNRANSKEAVASFDRSSLSTKNR
jgi:hypothetical protein